MEDLIINGKDALSEYGVRMGKGFLDAIEQPGNFKDYVSNKSRTEDGTRYTIIGSQVSERDLTLPFVLIGENPDIAKSRLQAFIAIMEGEVKVQIPRIGKDLAFYLLPLSYASFARNISHTVFNIKIKFKEPNPKRRNA